MADTITDLRALRVSASELRSLTEGRWPDKLIQDYLNIINSLITIVDEINTIVGESIFGTDDQIVVNYDEDDNATVSIDDNYLPEHVLEYVDEIDVDDNGDGTIGIGISDNFLPNNVLETTGEIDVDGTSSVAISLSDTFKNGIISDNEDLESFSFFMGQ